VSALNRLPNYKNTGYRLARKDFLTIETPSAGSSPFNVDRERFSKRGPQGMTAVALSSKDNTTEWSHPSRLARTHSVRGYVFCAEATAV